MYLKTALISLHEGELAPQILFYTCTTIGHRDENARLDVAASDIWGVYSSEHFFMCGCSTPTLYRIKPPCIQSSYLRQENEKRRKYEQQFVEIEHSAFVQFVRVACTGGIGPNARLETSSLPENMILPTVR